MALVKRVIEYEIGSKVKKGKLGIYDSSKMGVYWQTHQGHYPPPPTWPQSKSKIGFSYNFTVQNPVLTPLWNELCVLFLDVPCSGGVNDN